MFTAAEIRSFDEAQKQLQAEHDAREAKRFEAMRLAGYNPDGSPIKKDYQSLIDPATGKLKSEYQLKEEQLDMGKLEGLGELKKQALRQGMSPWALLMLQKQATEESQLRDEATRQSSSSVAQARSGMAMRGGIGSGSRERIAKEGSRDLLMTRQKASQQGNLNRLNLGVQDEQIRQDSLGKYTGLETDISKHNNLLTNKANEFNINTRLKDKEAGDAWSLDTYREQMKKWAANRQAEATERSGGGGGK